MYIDPFAYEPLVAVGLPPPVLPGGINGSTSLHSSSVRSLGYRNSLRSYGARFLLVHIGDPSSNQATTLESQMIHMIQELSGRTLRANPPPLAEDCGWTTRPPVTVHLRPMHIVMAGLRPGHLLFLL